MAEGIRYAAANGARIINLSLETPDRRPARAGRDQGRAGRRRADRLLGRQHRHRRRPPAAVPGRDPGAEPRRRRGDGARRRARADEVLQLRLAHGAGRGARRGRRLDRPRRRLRDPLGHVDGGAARRRRGGADGVGQPAAVGGGAARAAARARGALAGGRPPEPGRGAGVRAGRHAHAAGPARAGARRHGSCRRRRPRTRCVRSTAPRANAVRSVRLKLDGETVATARAGARFARPVVLRRTIGRRLVVEALGGDGRVLAARRRVRQRHAAAARGHAPARRLRRRRRGARRAAEGRQGADAHRAGRRRDRHGHRRRRARDRRRGPHEPLDLRRRPAGPRLHPVRPARRLPRLQRGPDPAAGRGRRERRAGRVPRGPRDSPPAPVRQLRRGRRLRARRRPAPGATSTRPTPTGLQRRRSAAPTRWGSSPAAPRAACSPDSCARSRPPGRLRSSARWSRRPPSTRSWTSTAATTTWRRTPTTPSGASRSARSATSRCSGSSPSCSGRSRARSSTRSRSAPARATSRSTCSRPASCKAATCTDISPGMLATLERNAQRARPRGRDRGLRRGRAAVRGRELRPRARPRRPAPPARPRPLRSPSSSACSSPAGLLFFAGEPSRSGDRIAAYPKRAAIKAAPLWRKALKARPAPTHHGAPDEDEHALEAVVDVHAFVPTDLQRHATEAGLRRRPRARGGAAGQLVRLVQPHARGDRGRRKDIPRGWIQYAYRGYILLQRVDRALLEPRLPPRIFYNLMLAARKPG